MLRRVVEFCAQVEYCECIFEESVVESCLYAVAVLAHSSVVSCDWQ